MHCITVKNGNLFDLVRYPPSTNNVWFISTFNGDFIDTCLRLLLVYDTTHWHQQEQHGLCHYTLIPARTTRLVSLHTDISKNNKACVTTHWRQQEQQGLCHNTLTPAGTPKLGLCHNTLTPARTPRLVWQHLDTSRITKAWAVSQYTDTSKNTKACVRTHWHQQEHQGLGCVPGLLQTMTGKVILTQTFFHQLQTR